MAQNKVLTMVEGIYDIVQKCKLGVGNCNGIWAVNNQVELTFLMPLILYCEHAQ